MKYLATALLIAACPVVAQDFDTEVLRRLSDADVVFLGEVHDNRHHHANQKRAVAALSPKAVVFEMLTPDQAEKVTPKLLADQRELARVLEWDNSGWPAFSMYYPIFAATGNAQVFGAQVPRDIARAAAMQGDVAVSFGADAENYSLQAELPDTEQALREDMQMQAHCNALPEDMLAGMVWVQRLRDATLARAVVAAIQATGGPVMVITGNGHARTDWGAPSLLPKDLNVVSLGQFESVPVGPEPFDLWVVTTPAEREDPCAAFK